MLLSITVLQNAMCAVWFTLNKISIKFRDISITWWCVSVESKFPARCYMREGTEQLHFALLLVSLLFGYFRKSFANCQSGNHSVFVCLCLSVSVCVCMCVCMCMFLSFFKRDHSRSTEAWGSINTLQTLFSGFKAKRHFMHLTNEM